MSSVRKRRLLRMAAIVGAWACVLSTCLSPLTAMFLSVLTPCQPHLAGALWVSRQAGKASGKAAEVEVHKSRQAEWGPTGMGSNGASLPDADNSGARGRGLKPEARAWYFKRPEWLWSQLSINRCTQSGKNKTWNGEKKRDDDRGQKILTVFFIFCFSMRQS